MGETSRKSGPGFQGSHTTKATVTIYQNGGDEEIVLDTGGTFPLDGRGERDRAPSIISVNTNKTIGAPSGNWSVLLKPSKMTDSLLKKIVDDDWVDISFWEHDKQWHTMRGLVDDIRQTKAIGANGATIQAFIITGQDFCKIWEKTPIWFSPYANNDLVTQSVANQIFNGQPWVKDPATAVKVYLRSFLEQMANTAGVNWGMPSGMPNTIGGSFIGSVKFNHDYFQNLPPRIVFNPNFLNPQGTLWGMAQQYSDPLFTEFYGDLLPGGDPWSQKIEDGDPLTPQDVQMTVVVRDKPFPIQTQAIPGYRDAWDFIPCIELPRQSIKTHDIGRSGIERFNAFYTASFFHQEALKAGALDQLCPLYDAQDIKRHGMRRFDVQSTMAPDPTVGSMDYRVLSEQQRELARDWYCLNPYMLSGTLVLGHGRPDIKVGCRVRIPGATLSAGAVEDDESYYVENVAHSWKFGPGTQTTLGVTRGWLGDDASYRNALQRVAARYKTAVLAATEQMTATEQMAAAAAEGWGD